jgi:TIR domain
MSPSPASGDVPALRRLAQLSILLAMANVVGTAAALARLPNAVDLGQWILIAFGALSSLSAFVFGVMITLRKPRARGAGFAAVGVAILAAALFSLLAYVVPEAFWIFTVWTAALLSYAVLATHRLVRWPEAGLTEEPKSRLAIFISYRRDDSRDTVGRVLDHLRLAFEEEHLFLDVNRQAPGEDYRRMIETALEQSDVLLVVIGPDWVKTTNREGRRRLLDPEDMVRIEIETALRRDLRIVPVLVEDAGMPRPQDLPPSLEPLCYRSALPVRPDPEFQPDMQRLVVALREQGTSARSSA